MILIRLRWPQEEQQGFWEIEAAGHSGYAEAGADIICAGVSALLETLVLGLRQCLGLAPEVAMRDGYLRCRLAWPQAAEQAAGAQLLFQTTALGLREMAAAYSRYLQVKEETRESR